MKNMLLICGLLALAAMPAGAGDQLKMAVSPAHSFASAVLRVRVSIEPSDANRSLEVIADGDQFYRSSEMQLEGDHLAGDVQSRNARSPGGRLSSRRHPEGRHGTRAIARLPGCQGPRSRDRRLTTLRISLPANCPRLLRRLAGVRHRPGSR